MILSVMRNTKSTVKFWFIENFLSPSFLVSVLLIVRQLLLKWLPGIHPTLRRSVRVPVRVCHVQMAVLAPAAEGETAHHLGIQDPVPRYPIPDGPQEGYLRRRRPDRPRGLERAGRP